MVYGIFTAGQRTWGGPRADAGQADTTTTPQDAIAHAEATGDDLNVVPETFRPAVEAMHLGRVLIPPRIPLQPAASIDGRLRMEDSDAESLASLRGEERETSELGLGPGLPERVK